MIDVIAEVFQRICTKKKSKLLQLDPTFGRLTSISNIFYDTMGNQVIASSAIIKKPDQLRMKLG